MAEFVVGRWVLDAVAAVMAVANILRSSLGPHGLDKMLVDDIGRASFSARAARGLTDHHASLPCLSVLLYFLIYKVPGNRLVFILEHRLCILQETWSSRMMEQLF